MPREAGATSRATVKGAVRSGQTNLAPDYRLHTSPAGHRCLRRGQAGPGYRPPGRVYSRADDRVALPIAHWRAPREDESEKLMAGLGVIRNALALAEVDQ